MKSKKTFALTALSFLLFGGSASWAQEITPAVAETIARQWLDTPAVELLRTEMDGDTPLLYIYNSVTENKWVIVSASGQVRNHVLGYSLDGRLDSAHLPEAFTATIDRFSAGIKASLVLNDEASPSIGNVPVRRKTAARVEATQPQLVQTIWGQSAPYNNYCPLLNGSRCLTGCVQTAMAQVLNFYQWPEQPKGTVSYLWREGNEELTSDLDSHRYLWDLMSADMRTASEGAKSSVAQLMFDLGVINQAHYDPVATGSDVNIQGLIENLDYDRDIKYLPLSGCNIEEAEAIFCDDLLQGHPILVGASGPNGAHEFIMDGFDDKGYFHYNFGWNGNADGYYLITATGYDTEPHYYYNLKPNAGGTGKLSLYSQKDFTLVDGAISGELYAACYGDYEHKKNIEVSLALEDENQTLSYDTPMMVSDGCVKEGLSLSLTPGDGVYSLYPVARLDGGDWERFHFADLRQDHINVLVENGKVTMSNGDVLDPLDEGKVEVDHIFYTLTKSTKKASVVYKNAKKASYSGDVVIPDNITYDGVTYNVAKIEESAFEGSTDLRTLYVGKNVSNIAYGAISMTGLTEITFAEGSGLKTIGGWAFNNSQLTSLVLPKGFTTLGTCALQSNPLVTLDLPNTVTTISEGAIWAQSLRDLYVHWTGTPRSFKENIFMGTFSNPLNKINLHVPYGTADKYKTVTPWKSFNIVEEPDGITPVTTSEKHNDGKYLEGPTVIIYKDNRRHRLDGR